MGADLDVEPVLERGDDPPAAGVVLGVGAGDDDHVERQAHLEPFDLKILFFHQIEQADLHFFGQVGQLVDREEAPVGARNQAVVDRLFVGQIAPFGHLDRVDLTDQVGHGHVRRGQLFGVAFVARQPADFQVVATFGRQAARLRRDGRQRILRDFGVADRRHVLVEQRGQAADHARLRLAPLAEKHDVVAGENGVFDLGNDGVVVPDDAEQETVARGQRADQVGAHLLPDGNDAVADSPELADRMDFVAQRFGRKRRGPMLGHTHLDSSIGPAASPASAELGGLCGGGG